MKVKKAVGVFVTLLFLLGAGELVARHCLGLGDPPLTETHPTIEYLLKPNQDVMRFGNHFIVNAYGMRSEQFPVTKPSGELRVMVFGDSVVNGANQTDHASLATTLFSERLSERVHNPVVVGNISAKSWGPGNWLAYAKEYGFFDADVVVLVISSHDFRDNPSFQPLDPKTQPTVKPPSALLEGITSYLPRYIPKFPLWGSGVEVSSSIDESDESAQVRQALGDLRDFLGLARQQGREVIVMHHAELNEVQNDRFNEGHEQIKRVAQEFGVPSMELAPIFRRALADGETPYLDYIHLNPLGQELLATALSVAIESYLETR